MNHLSPAPSYRCSLRENNIGVFRGERNTRERSKPPICISYQGNRAKKLYPKDDKVAPFGCTSAFHWHYRP
ncbi:MAG: hypothetical protein AMJ46_11860 [Latescibacteria bacterium DG_63]|nr:MAG: hypothetical protein AMJ46_11860 [Latescibacteria bacterium DG_63]